jgi:hypothetical protein
MMFALNSVWLFVSLTRCVQIARARFVCLRECGRSHEPALIMVAVETSETSVHWHQSTRRYNPQDSHLHSHRRENLKSYYTGRGHYWGTLLRSEPRSLLGDCCYTFWVRVILNPQFLWTVVINTVSCPCHRPWCDVNTFRISVYS